MTALSRRWRFVSGMRFLTPAKVEREGSPRPAARARGMFRTAARFGDSAPRASPSESGRDCIGAGPRRRAEDARLEFGFRCREVPGGRRSGRGRRAGDFPPARSHVHQPRDMGVKRMDDGMDRVDSVGYGVRVRARGRDGVRSAFRDRLSIGFDERPAPVFRADARDGHIPISPLRRLDTLIRCSRLDAGGSSVESGPHHVARPADQPAGIRRPRTIRRAARRPKRKVGEGPPPVLRSGSPLPAGAARWHPAPSDFRVGPRTPALGPGARAPGCWRPASGYRRGILSAGADGRAPHPKGQPPAMNADDRGPDDADETRAHPLSRG